MSLQVITGCFLPATFWLGLPDSVVGPLFLMKLLHLSSILDSHVGASALRAKTPCPRPPPALKLGAIWGGSLVYLEFPTPQHLDRNRTGAMKMVFLHCVNQRIKDSQGLLPSPRLSPQQLVFFFAFLFCIFYSPKNCKEGHKWSKKGWPVLLLKTKRTAFFFNHEG